MFVTEYFILWPPRHRQDNSVAKLTEMRIMENNVASLKIMLIQGQQQEVTVESAEYMAPDKPGAGASVQWPRGHMGHSQGVSSSGLPVAVAWGFGRCTRAVWMAVCLCPSAWQGRRQPLLRAWFGCHCCQEKRKLPAANTITFVSYIPLLNVAIKCLPLCPVPR